MPHHIFNGITRFIIGPIFGATIGAMVWALGQETGNWLAINMLAGIVLFSLLSLTKIRIRNLALILWVFPGILLGMVAGGMESVGVFAGMEAGAKVVGLIGAILGLFLGPIIISHFADDEGIGGCSGCLVAMIVGAVAGFLVAAIIGAIVGGSVGKFNETVDRTLREAMGSGWLANFAIAVSMLLSRVIVGMFVAFIPVMLWKKAIFTVIIGALLGLGVYAFVVRFDGEGALWVHSWAIAGLMFALPSMIGILDDIGDAIDDIGG